MIHLSSGTRRVIGHVETSRGTCLNHAQLFEHVEARIIELFGFFVLMAGADPLLQEILKEGVPLTTDSYSLIAEFGD